LGDRQRRPPALSATDGLYARDRNTREFAANRRLAIE